MNREAPESKRFHVRIGDWFFKYRNYAFPSILLALLAGLQPQPLAQDPALDRWLNGVGIGLAVLGSGFRIWVIGLAYIKRGGRDKAVYADTLVRGGMFGVCRNPLYVGNLLVLLGLFVIHNHPLVYWLGIPFFAGAYFAIVAAEEHFLRAKFGAAFAEYCATVNRFIPDFGRYRDACQDMAFNWRRPLVKEYQTVYAWVMGVLALLSYEKASWGLSAPAPEFQSWRTILIAAAVATAMVGLTKLLKKLRWLTAD